jgi:phenylalanyl-tRNA synthetase alpha chain
MFHQCEGFVVDRDISFGDMKGTLDVLLKAVFGPGAETRMRPSFFPFVEPGAEVDMRCVSCEGKGCRICKMTGWLEIAGCGMIHPNVFESVGYDSEEYTGFAFGFGLDRMAMLKYGLGNLRQLFEADHAFLGQFPVFASF